MIKNFQLKKIAGVLSILLTLTAVGVAQPAPKMYFGPAGAPNSTGYGNVNSNCEHLSTSLHPAPDFNSISGNYVYIVPKEIKNFGNMALSFGLCNGHKSQDTGYTSAFSFTGATAGVLFDNAPDVTAEVSFNAGASWVLLTSFAGKSSLTSIFTSDAALMQAPIDGGLVLNPGDSVQFLIRYTIPAARLNGRINFKNTIYAGWYFPGTNTPLYGNGFVRTQIPTFINGVGPIGSGCDQPEVFEADNDVIVGNILDLQKTVTVINATGVGGPTNLVPGATLKYLLTIKGKAQNHMPTTPSYGSGALLWSLPASSTVITEDGSVAPNNWATNTGQVVGSAVCSVPVTVLGDAVGSSVVTFNLTNPVQPNSVQTCEFYRILK